MIRESLAIPRLPQGILDLEADWATSIYTGFRSSSMSLCTKPESAFACSCRRMSACLQKSVSADAACNTESPS